MLTSLVDRDEVGWSLTDAQLGSECGLQASFTLKIRLVLAQAGV